MSQQQNGADLVKKIVGEIAAMEYAGDVKAIASVVIDKDGDIRVLTAFQEGQKIAIIAGCSILQRHVMECLKVIDKKPNI